MVTPWEVEGDHEIDYDKLVKTFGSMRITEVGTLRVRVGLLTFLCGSMGLFFYPRPTMARQHGNINNTKQ